MNKEININLDNFQETPGAPYIKTSIREQEELKKNKVFQLFSEFGNIKNPQDFFDEFISSPKTFHYRNKMEYSFSSIMNDPETNIKIDAFGLGFKRKGQWITVENLDSDSGMFDPIIENNLHKIRTWCEKSGLPAWNPPQSLGFYRYITVKKSFLSNTFLINFVTTSENINKFKIKDFLSFLQQILGNRLSGLLHTINDGKGDKSKNKGSKTQLIYGKPYLEDEINKLRFKIGIDSFFQPNPLSAEKLYDKVTKYALSEVVSKKKYIMDLFCGIGTIGQIISNSIHENIKVIGVDIEKESIEHAKENAEYNQLHNIEFFSENVNSFLFKHPEYVQNISTVIIDPPRSGIATKALKKVMNLEPKVIIYISCNPNFLARDIPKLYEREFKLNKFTLIDQFPHTKHIECIGLFIKT